MLWCERYLERVLWQLVGSRPSPDSASSLPPGLGSQTGFSGWCGCNIERLRFKGRDKSHFYTEIPRQLRLEGSPITCLLFIWCDLHRMEQRTCQPVILHNQPGSRIQRRRDQFDIERHQHQLIWVIKMPDMGHKQLNKWLNCIMVRNSDNNAVTWSLN